MAAITVMLTKTQKRLVARALESVEVTSDERVGRTSRLKRALTGPRVGSACAPMALGGIWRTTACTRSVARAGARVAVSTAPRRAAETALPILRKNCTEAVATPRSLQGTDDCTAMSIEVVLLPRPTPATNDEMRTTKARRAPLQI